MRCASIVCLFFLLKAVAVSRAEDPQRETSLFISSLLKPLPYHSFSSLPRSFQPSLKQPLQPTWWSLQGNPLPRSISSISPSSPPSPLPNSPRPPSFHSSLARQTLMQSLQSAWWTLQSRQEELFHLLSSGDVPNLLSASWRDVVEGFSAVSGWLGGLGGGESRDRFYAVRDKGGVISGVGGSFRNARPIVEYVIADNKVIPLNVPLANGENPHSL